ncbi:class I SAM-dependent methyltransferase [Marivibrio halodurans]|nr:class I SAM-dependent methyltransferase [Marivibrio halodurans]
MSGLDPPDAPPPSIKAPSPDRPPIRKRLRRMAMGAATLTGLARRGYFIPYRYAPSDRPAGGYPALTPLFEAAAPAMRDVLAEAEAHRERFHAFDGAAPPEPRWQQGWYPRLDGLAAYMMIQRHRPRRVVEVGSGHSTRFLAAAAGDLAAREAGTDSAITAIDPAPRADLSRLAGVTLHRAVAQAADPALFRALGPGDVLAVDSSHIAMPGTDVDWLIGHVLPGLPAGALLAMHDIFLPDPYPPAWDWRGYNEQGAIAALLAGGGWRVLWSSHWVATRMAAAVAAGVAGTLPLPAGAHESALWLERLGRPQVIPTRAD